MKQKFTWKTVDMILTFLFLEMHTDNSTNCTLLGPVDCDSFYKWIPLNRWPGCHLIRGIAFYLLCSLFSVSLSHVHHIVYSPPPSPPFPSPPRPPSTNGRAGSTVWVPRQVLCHHKCAEKSGRRGGATKLSHDHFVWIAKRAHAHAHTSTTGSASFLFPLSDQSLWNIPTRIWHSLMMLMT